MAENGMTAYLSAMQTDVQKNNKALDRYNRKFQSDDDSSTGPRALFSQGNELRESGTATETVVSSYNSYEAALATVSEAKQAFVNAVAAQLGIEAPVEKPRPSKTEYEKAKETRTSVFNLLKTLEEIGQYAPTPEDKDRISAFVTDNQPPEKLARPEIERKATGPSAPKYRVDVTWTDSEGIAVKESGFTKAALATGKDGPTAADFRTAYESAGGNGKGEFSTTVELNGANYVLTNRVKAEN
ncbi:MAG: hypothetical protein ACREOB_09830 [Thermodesulfobacteriota bacterium]